MKYVFAAYEDVWYYLWRERKLPANLDPFDAKLDDALERERLGRVFSQGLEKIVGHLLPIQRSGTAKIRWQSGPWFLRTQRCYLASGDSPLGLRLPLDSQPWVSNTDYPWIHRIDPTQRDAPLPAWNNIARLFSAQAATQSQSQSSVQAASRRGQSDPGAAAPLSDTPPERKGCGLVEYYRPVAPSRDPRGRG